MAFASAHLRTYRLIDERGHLRTYGLIDERGSNSDILLHRGVLTQAHNGAEISTCNTSLPVQIQVHILAVLREDDTCCQSTLFRKNKIRACIKLIQKNSMPGTASGDESRLSWILRSNVYIYSVN
jgi:hypothetical protein